MRYHHLRSPSSPLLKISPQKISPQKILPPIYPKKPLISPPKFTLDSTTRKLSSISTPKFSIKPQFKYLNRRFWIEGNDQNSNCALTKNEISHKLRLAVGRGINKSMLEKELSETGRNAKIVLGNESSDEEADEDVDQPAAQQFPVCDMCFGTARENYLRFARQNLSEKP